MGGLIFVDSHRRRGEHHADKQENEPANTLLDELENRDVGETSNTSSTVTIPRRIPSESVTGVTTR